MKDTMSTEQKKLLEKIVKQKVQEKRNGLHGYGTKNEKEKELVEQTEKTNRKRAEKEYIKLKSLRKQEDETLRLIKSLGFDESYGDKRHLQISLTSKQQDIVRDWQNARLKKLDDVEMKLLAKIWGLGGDFESLMKEIEKDLAI